MNQEEIFCLVLDELRKALDYGRALYSPELHRRMPSQILGVPECINKLLEKQIIFSHAGYLFLNPNYYKKHNNEILDSLEL